MGGGIHLGFDATSLLILVLIAALVVGVVGYIGPELAKVADTVAGVQYAPRRAELRAQAEQANILSMAEATKTASEIAKLKAQVDADVARQAATANLEKVRGENASNLARLENEQRSTAQLLTILLVGVCLASVVAGGLVGNTALSTLQINRNERARIEAHKELVLSAINQMRVAGGEVTLDNGRTFKVYKPEMPLLQPDNVQPLPAGLLTDTADNLPSGVAMSGAEARQVRSSVAR